MSSTQGVQPEPPKIPDELRIAIENAQNRYTVLESEIARLAKLNKIERRNVDIALEEQDRLKAENEEIRNEIKKNSDALANMKGVINETEKKMGAMLTAQNELNAELLAAGEKKGVLLGEAEALRAELVSLKADIEKKTAENTEAIKRLAPFVDSVHTLFKAL